MRKAYGYSRRLKGKPSALFPGGARLCYLMGALSYLSCPAIHCATARSNAAPLFWRFNSKKGLRECFFSTRNPYSRSNFIECNRYQAASWAKSSDACFLSASYKYGAASGAPTASGLGRIMWHR